MKKAVDVLGITISALTMAYGTVGAMAEPQSDQQAHSHSTDQGSGGSATAQGDMMCGGMMGRGMVGRGTMGGGMMGAAMGPPMMFRMVFALMDDGDRQSAIAGISGGA